MTNSKKAALLSTITTAIKTMYVETAQSALARERLTEFFLAFSPAQQSACMTLEGVSGSGKTTLLKNFLMHDVPRLVGGDGGSALYVEVPSKCSQKSVAQAILQALGDPLWQKGSGTDLKYRIGKILREKNYRILALDECQHMIESRNDRVLYDVADWLKSAINLWSIPVVLSGLPKIRAIIEANDQLDGRTFRSGRLHALRWDDKDEQRDYRVVLKRYDETLPFAQRAGLEDPQIARKIHYLTDGLLGRTARLVILAAINAARVGSPAITSEALGEAFEELRTARDELKDNPFLKGSTSARPGGENDASPEMPLKPSAALHRELSARPVE